MSTGLDAEQMVLDRTDAVVGLVGLHPEHSDPTVVSGYVDIRSFSARNALPAYLVKSDSLFKLEDRELFVALDLDLIWVACWQRLIPKWLIARAPSGALGSHGSSHSIEGGWGRSPRNLALILGCKQFSIALFRIMVVVEEGNVVA